MDAVIKYNLICSNDHEFEIWFSKGSDFDDQAPKGLIACPDCGVSKVEKAIMAPAVSTARKKEKMKAQNKQALQMMNAAADKIRKEISENCDYVGDKFVDEARAINYGDSPERGIYGEASAQEAAELRDEGVEIASLPAHLSPKSKSKSDLN